MSASTRDGVQLLSDLASRAGKVIGAHLQIADRCNHTCVHCYQVQGQKGELTLSQLEHVIDDLTAAGVMMLNVSGGEATLRDDLLEILTYARKKGCGIRLYTNAFALDDRLADGIAAIGVLEVHVSVYSDRDEEHDAVTRVPGSLHRTLAGIRRLRARNVRVLVKSPLLAAAPGAYPRLKALAEELGCDFRASNSITPIEDGSLESLAACQSPEDLVKTGGLLPWVPDEDAAAERAKKLASAPCGVCKTSIAVMPNGEVRPCTDTLVPLGNLMRNSLREIATDSADTFAMFRTMTWNDVHGCRDCDLISACHRCHASAVHENRDYLGPYASACAAARAAYRAGSGTLEILPPDPACEMGRDPMLGPYRIESRGRLRPTADEVHPDDDERARRHPWIRAGQDYSRERLSAGDFVPVRSLRRESRTIVDERKPDPGSPT